MKQYKKSLVIFRRDLRLHDNTALQEALEKSDIVIPVFIFDPRQITKKNIYKSTNAIQFMLESLTDLERQLKKQKATLYYFYGLPHQIVKELIEKEKIDAVFVNRDYTPFSINRDQRIKQLCLEHAVAFESLHDLLLHAPEKTLKTDGTPYNKFTPFWRKCSRLSVSEPVALPGNSNFYSGTLIGAQKSAQLFPKILSKKNKDIHQKGGRSQAQAILQKLEKFKDYPATRDFPTIATTNLSAHHKFGTISIRESYHAIKKTLSKNHELLKQLFWRDFFTQIAYFSTFVFGQPFQEKYKNLSWNSNKDDFDRWCKGQTGFPLVDAGMRQLNKTGFMHNRARMVVASFLVKDLHINWLWGEKYFAKKLIDYDPAVNNGNWQWCASTGADSQPYFRIFNPWLQQKKFDPQCKYIKKWVPELKKLKADEIHGWYSSKLEVARYPKPMVQHERESKKAKLLYKKISQS